MVLAVFEVVSLMGFVGSLEFGGGWKGRDVGLENERHGRVGRRAGRRVGRGVGRRLRSRGMVLLSGGKDGVEGTAEGGRKTGVGVVAANVLGKEVCEDILEGGRTVVLEGGGAGGEGRGEGFAWSGFCL